MVICDHNHLILYAKNWYDDSDDLMADLKKIVCRRSNISEEFCRPAHVWAMCMDALQTYGRDTDIVRVLNDSFKPAPGERGKALIWWDDNCPLERAIRNILTVLAMLSIVDGNVLVLNLDEPDPELLPIGDEQLASYREQREAMMRRTYED